MSRGAENGYTYTGDVGSYLVTMLRREIRKGASLVRIEKQLTGDGPSIPVGHEVTIPTRRLTVRK